HVQLFTHIYQLKLIPPTGMRYLLPLFECEIETMMLKTKYYRKKDYFIIIIVYLVMSLPYINKRQIIIY
ncbi:hypothetical protein, partial [Phocaeicola coprocola]